MVLRHLLQGNGRSLPDTNEAILSRLLNVVDDKIGMLFPLAPELHLAGVASEGSLRFASLPTEPAQISSRQMQTALKSLKWLKTFGKVLNAVSSKSVTTS
jgi:hypothetical protein